MVIGGIVAGGIGARMGTGTIPKQFMEVGGKPVIIHTIEKFLVCLGIDYVVIGVHPEWLDYMEDLIAKYIKDKERIAVTPGDSNRNGTINKIIEKSKELWKIDDETIFVTHDAVRPFVNLKIIEDNIQAAAAYGVCDTVIAATDTIVRSSNQEYITDIPVRNEMYQGQTPQTFKYGLFRAVYDSMTEEELKIVTDACKMFHLRGHQVQLVEGCVSNIKITYPFDLQMARIMLEG